MLAGQHARELGLLDPLAQAPLRALEVDERHHRLLRRRERDQLVRLVDVAQQPVELVEVAQRPLELALLAQDALGLFAVVPEGGVPCRALQLLESRPLRDEVKDASAAPRCGRVARGARLSARESWRWYLRTRTVLPGRPVHSKWARLEHADETPNARSLAARLRHAVGRRDSRRVLRRDLGGEGRGRHGARSPRADARDRRRARRTDARRGARACAERLAGGGDVRRRPAVGRASALDPRLGRCGPDPLDRPRSALSVRDSHAGRGPRSASGRVRRECTHRPLDGALDRRARGRVGRARAVRRHHRDPAAEDPPGADRSERSRSVHAGPGGSERVRARGRREGSRARRARSALGLGRGRGAQHEPLDRAARRRSGSAAALPGEARRGARPARQPRPRPGGRGDPGEARRRTAGSRSRSSSSPPSGDSARSSSASHTRWCWPR